MRTLLCIQAAVLLMLTLRADADASFSWGITEKTVDFSGHKWYIKDSTEPLQPGPCYWTADNVKTDGGGLQLSVARAASGSWMSSEVMIDQSFGYGTYEVVVKDALADHNENVVFGAFIWDETNPIYNGEIDLMEASRFGDPYNPFNAQFVIAPWNVDGRINRFAIPATATSAVLTLRWSPTALQMSVACPETGYSFSWEPQDASIIPVPSGNERLHLNAWQNFGNGPTDAQPVTFHVQSFTFSSTVSTAPLNSSTIVLNATAPPLPTIPPTTNLTNLNDSSLASPTPTPYWYYPGRIDPPPAATAVSNFTLSPAMSPVYPNATPWYWWIGRGDPPAASPNASDPQPAPAPTPLVPAPPPKQVVPSLVVSQPSSAYAILPNSLLVIAIFGCVASSFL